MKTVAGAKPRMAEFVKDNGKYFNSAYLPYQPTSPRNGLPSSFMLDLSFRAEKTDPFYATQIQKIQDKLGVNKVVWGYKRGEDNQPIWEVYFYHHKKYPENRYENVLDLMKPFLSFDPKMKTIEDGYYLVSTEMTKQSTPCINVYYPIILDEKDLADRYYLTDTPYFFSIKNDAVSIAQKILQDKTTMLAGNIYYKVRMPRSVAQVVNLLEKHTKKFLKVNPDKELFRRIFGLPFMKRDDGINLPYLITEKPQRQAIGLYFLGISYDNLVDFLEFFDYPKEYIYQIKKYRSQLEYLQMDMGFDIKVENDKLIYQKPCIPGTF